MNELESVIAQLVNDQSAKIITIIQEEHPKILANLSTDIFETKGQIDGRNWQDNTFYTAKRKGKNHRNVETGTLEEMFATPGFLEDDNYMENIPSPSRGSSYGYQAANDINDGANRFDNIGRTEADLEIIDRGLETVIAQRMADK